MKRRQFFANAAKTVGVFLLALGGGEALAQSAFNFPDSPTLNQVVSGPSGQQFKWDGTKWIAVAGSGSSFTAGGDLSGTNTSQTVVGIKGVVVPTPAAGYLQYTGSVYAWTTPVVPRSDTVSWLAGANPANGTLYYADTARTIVSLTGMVEIANGGAATISVVKANGGLLSAGTVVHSGSFNANGTAGTYQPLTLTVTSLAAGDRLGLTTTGTWTAAVGSINVVVQ